MPKVSENRIAGKSGKEYQLNVYTRNVQFNDFIPGVYVISEVNGEQEKCIFLGETDNIYPLLKAHPKQADFDSENYNRVSFYKNASREVRVSIVDDLMPVLDPVCKAG
jgi:hypothetical protein